MAILSILNIMVLDMIDIGVCAENRKYVDQQWELHWKTLLVKNQIYSNLMVLSIPSFSLRTHEFCSKEML